MREATSKRAYKVLVIWIVVLYVLSITIAAKLASQGYFSFASTFALLSNLLLLIPHRRIWALSLSWALVAVIMLALQLFAAITDASVSEGVLVGAQMVNSLVQIALTIYFFRPPYLNYRTSILGFGYRVMVDLDAELADRNDVLTKVKIINLSISGVAIATTDPYAFKQGQYTLRIPEIDNFKMAAQVARKDENLVAFQFVITNFKSVREQLKLFRWLRKSKQP